MPGTQRGSKIYVETRGSKDLFEAYHGTRLSEATIKKEGLRIFSGEEMLQLASRLTSILAPSIGSRLRRNVKGPNEATLDELLEMHNRDAQAIFLTASKKIAENYAYRGSEAVMTFAEVLSVIKGEPDVDYRGDPDILYPKNPGLVVTVKIGWEDIDVRDRPRVKNILSRREKSKREEVPNVDGLTMFDISDTDFTVKAVSPSNILSIEKVY